MENEKARCSKFFWEFLFELRDIISNTLITNLIEIINVAANHELILEQEKATKKNNSTPKYRVLTL